MNEALKWVRAEDGIVGGVCLGLSRQFDVDPLWVRLGWLISICFFGTGLFVYFLCLLAFPRKDKLDTAYDKKILGVCAKLAQRGSIEVGLVRLLALVLLVSSAGMALVAYIGLYFALPVNPDNKSRSIF